MRVQDATWTSGDARQTPSLGARRAVSRWERSEADEPRERIYIVAGTSLTVTKADPFFLQRC